MSLAGKYVGLMLSVALCTSSLSAVAEEKMMAAEVIKVKKDKILVKSSRKFLCITLFNKQKGKYSLSTRQCLSKRSISRYSIDLTREKPLVSLFVNTCGDASCSARVSFELDLLLYDAKGKLLIGDNKAKQKKIATKMFSDIARALSR